MPLHLGSRTKVHLVTANLDQTTTDNPSNKKAAEVTRHIELVEQTLKDGHQLKESHIPVAGDHSTLHLLGNGEDYMPFMMVRAGEDLRQVPASEDEPVLHLDSVHNDVYARILGKDPSSVIKSPQALALRVELSKQSFLKTDKPPEDIRIDVFYNGQLSHSTFWPKRYYQEDNKHPRSLLNVFSGIRTQWMCERAWIIVPPGEDPDGSRQRPVASAETLKNRWDNIQRELLKDAVARGVDVKGNRPVVAKYLTEISKLTMPPEVETWSESRGQRFGIIDVVLSYGQGSKDAPAKVYISEPTRMRCSKFKEQDNVMLSSKSLLLLHGRDSANTTSRYNFRSVTPEISTADSGQKPTKSSYGFLPVEHVSTHSGPLVNEKGNVISSSEQLPSYLTTQLQQSGYRVWTGSSRRPMGSSGSTSGKGPIVAPGTLHGLPFTTPNNLAAPVVINLESQSPITATQCQRPPRQLNRTQPTSGRLVAPKVAQLEEIPEEDEEVLTSTSSEFFTGLTATAHSNPKGSGASFSSTPAGSSQGTKQFRPLFVFTTGSTAGLPSPRGSLLPPVQIHTSVRARRIAIEDEEGSPRKKRRLSSSRALNIKVPEGFGINQRGVFVPSGTPNDKSHQRSKFNSFTLGSIVYPDQEWAPRRRPPVSPITPDYISAKNHDPLINRLVINNRDKVIRAIDFSAPFRRSEIPAVARSAKARSASTRRAWESTHALNTALTTPQTPESRMAPRSGGSASQRVSTSSNSQPEVPRTPAPTRTRTRSQSIESAISADGGIYQTPAPLPRFNHHPRLPSTPVSQSDSAAHSFASQRQQTNTSTTPASSSFLAAPSSVGSSSSSSSSSSRHSRAARPDDPAHPHAQMERAFRSFEVPELSKDCCITYAMPPASERDRAWAPGEARAFGGGVVRQVRSERTGEFEEEGVLIGVRFVVI